MPFSDIIPEIGGGASLLIMFVLFGIGAALEWISPAERKQPLRNTLLNVAYATITGWLGVAVGPLIGIATTALINGLGGGWIDLPATGGGVIVSVVVYLLAVDFLEYIFHRAQHALPFLWAMHSFHHSDPGVNVTTTARHYWLEMPLKALCVYPLLAILFKVPPIVLFVYGLSTVWHYVNHLNVRWRFPVSWVVINNPQFHRIHHSLLPQHQNKNFAPYFPVWDLIFGTAYAPAPDEYPPTGLDTGETASNLADATLWPLSKSLKRLRVAAERRQ